MGRLILVWLAGCLPAFCVAAELPNPLSLEHALTLADEPHPDRERAFAAVDEARAEQMRLQADDAVRVDLTLAARLIEPSFRAEPYEPSNNDSWAKLRISKRLYDFGRSDYLDQAANAELRGRELELLDQRQRRRLDVMARFFDVLLADLEQARDTEAMAIAYVRMDRARTRNELGRTSDVDLLDLESRYQNLLVRQRTSQAKQRATRARLAIALNRPEQLPSDLTTPALADLGREPGEVEDLVGAALEHNPRLRALREAAAAAEKRVTAATAGYGAVIRGEIEGAAYNRTLGGSDPFAAALVLDVPLFDGGRQDADAAREGARLRRARADLSARDYEVRQAVLDLWLELQTLQARRKELQTLGEFRELDFDRTRTLYELEVASDLGDAMTRISEFRLAQAENDYNIALAQARLEALTGRLLAPGSEETR